MTDEREPALYLHPNAPKEIRDLFAANFPDVKRVSLHAGGDGRVYGRRADDW